MAIGLVTARTTEKLPESREPCAVLFNFDGPSLEPDGAADAGTAASAAGPPSAARSPCDLPTMPPATTVRACSRRCGDGSAVNAEAPLRRAVCGDMPLFAVATQDAGALRAPLLRTAGTGAALPYGAGKQPAQQASVAQAEGLGQLDPLEGRRGWGERRGVRSMGMRSAGLTAATHASPADAAWRR